MGADGVVDSLGAAFFVVAFFGDATVDALRRLLLLTFVSSASPSSSCFRFEVDGAGIDLSSGFIALIASSAVGPSR